ncbi:MAG: MFS transporter [Lachnospiraceae bacterium]|nr:MFS transporter [Lachnospiraceae bacterium]
MKNHNQVTYGLGTLGRDMVYTLISMYLMFYLTDVLQLSTTVLWWVTAIIMAARVFDAFNDPIMGVIVDNTHTRYGKFKPWICIGAILSGILTVVLFADFGLTDGAFIAVFGITYVAWGISYTMHDISYWSMLPTLSQDLRMREKIGSVARICASIGLFAVVSLVVPITTMLGEASGSLQKGYFLFAIITVVFMWVFLCFTVFGVKEPRLQNQSRAEHTSLKELVRIIFKNDQLLVTAVAMALFMIGYSTTTSFGLYYFKYVYGDEGMYSIFALILGVSQIFALAVFPVFGAKFTRRKLYTAATFMVIIGYVIFFFAPTDTMLFIGVAGLILFIGQAFIQVLTLMFLTDSVEYGEWKFGKRNDSVTFSLQPFINKMGGAIASGITGATVIISGMSEATGPQDMSSDGLLILKVAMMILPLICIVIGFVIYRRKYILDEKMYAKIVEELHERNK